MPSELHSIQRSRDLALLAAEHRRPLNFWKPFNEWWRTEFGRLGRRPKAQEIITWYDNHAWRTWGHYAPTIQETRIHAKCLRSLHGVRAYFRTYRAKKRGDTPGEEQHGDCEYADEDEEYDDDDLDYDDMSDVHIQPGRVYVKGGAERVRPRDLSTDSAAYPGTLCDTQSDNSSVTTSHDTVPSVACRVCHQQQQHPPWLHYVTPEAPLHKDVVIRPQLPDVQILDGQTVTYLPRRHHQHRHFDDGVHEATKPERISTRLQTSAYIKRDVGDEVTTPVGPIAHRHHFRMQPLPLSGTPNASSDGGDGGGSGDGYHRTRIRKGRRSVRFRADASRWRRRAKRLLADQVFDASVNVPVGGGVTSWNWAGATQNTRVQLLPPSTEAPTVATAWQQPLPHMTCAVAVGTSHNVLPCADGRYVHARGGFPMLSSSGRPPGPGQVLPGPGWPGGPSMGISTGLTLRPGGVRPSATSLPTSLASQFVQPQYMQVPRVAPEMQHRYTAQAFSQ